MTLSIPDESYSNLMTLSIPDEGYSNLMTLSIPDEGYSRNVSYILKLDINFLVNRGQAKSSTQYLIKKGEK